MARIKQYVADKPLLAWGAIVVALVAIGVRIFFWAYTHRVWEDSLITILHAENAVRGLGLTHYKLYEGPIHGFTSPLSVLIPLLGEVIHKGFGLSFIRLVSIFAAAGSCLLALWICVGERKGLALPVVFSFIAPFYIALEHHQILWGMTGMETQVVVLILLGSIAAYMFGNGNHIGAMLGLCMLVRPDYAMWTIIIGCGLIYRSYITKSVGPLLRPVVVALSLYVPWVIFTTLYYGSPVPNTVLAKSGGYGGWIENAHTLGAVVDGFLARLKPIFLELGPSFGGNGTGFAAIGKGWLWAVLVLILGIIGGVSLLKSKRPGAWLIPAFVIVYTIYYACYVPILFGWYLVPLNAVYMILAAQGLYTVAKTVSGLNIRRLSTGPVLATFSALGLVYIAFLASHLPLTFTAERRIQMYIENPIRVAIGKWLHETTPLEATIGGEPLGFIGYHSRRNYWDYPGLASRDVVNFVRDSGAKGLNNMLMEFRPDYAILRSFEVEQVVGDWFTKAYEPVKVYEVTAEDREKLMFPELNMDLSYVVFRRKVERTMLNFAREQDWETATPVIYDEQEVFGSWKQKGIYPGQNLETLEEDAYGSWVTGDADVGGQRATIMSIEGVKGLLIPFMTGPDTSDLSITVQIGDDETSQQSLSLMPNSALMPKATAGWRYWKVSLPADLGSQVPIHIVTEDSGRDWGQWVAIKSLAWEK